MRNYPVVKGKTGKRTSMLRIGDVGNFHGNVHADADIAARGFATREEMTGEREQENRDRQTYFNNDHRG